MRTIQLPAQGCGIFSPGGELLQGILQQLMPQIPGFYFPAHSVSMFNNLRYMAMGFFFGEAVIIR